MTKLATNRYYYSSKRNYSQLSHNPVELSRHPVESHDGLPWDWYSSSWYLYLSLPHILSTPYTLFGDLATSQPGQMAAMHDIRPRNKFSGLPNTMPYFWFWLGSSKAHSIPELTKNWYLSSSIKFFIYDHGTQIDAVRRSLIGWGIFMHFAQCT